MVGPEVRARADVLAQVLRVVRDRLLRRCSGSVASVPVAAAPAALGRPWKYFAFVKVWPSSFEPTTLPSTVTLEPFALSANADLGDAR